MRETVEKLLRDSIYSIEDTTMTVNRLLYLYRGKEHGQTEKSNKRTSEGIGMTSEKTPTPTCLYEKLKSSVKNKRQQKKKTRKNWLQIRIEN